MDTDIKETLDTDASENLDMNVEMPAEIKVMIIEAFEKYCAKQREKEKDKAREREITWAEWREYNKTLKELLPRCLREFMFEKQDDEISPPTNNLTARIEIPGLAPIMAKINEQEGRTSSLIVSVPKKHNHEWILGEGQGHVIYHFPDRGNSFNVTNLGGALLSARREALRFNELFAEVELENQEYAKMQAQREKENAEREARGPEPVYEATDETVNNALVEGIRTLIREELAKVTEFCRWYPV